MVIVLTTRGFRAVNPAHIGALECRQVGVEWVRTVLKDLDLAHIEVPPDGTVEMVSLYLGSEWIDMMAWYSPTEEDLQRPEVIAQNKALVVIMEQMRDQAIKAQMAANEAARNEELDRIAPRIIVPGQ